MKPRDIILEAFEGARPERVPVALVGGGMWSSYQYGTTLKELSTDPAKMSDMLVKMAAKLRSDIVYVGSGYPNLLVAALGGKIKFRDIGAPDIEESIVNNDEDLLKLDMSRLHKDKIINTLYEAFMITRSTIGGEYVVTMTAWGPFTLGARFTGEEEMMKAVFKRPAFANRVLEFAVELLKSFYEPLLREKLLDVILLGEPTASGDLISKKLFEQFVLPHLRRFTEWAKSKDVHTILHICGDTADRIDLFPLTGASCVSLDHKVDIRKAKELLLGKMCFAGNIDPVKVLLRGTVEQVESECVRVISEAGTDGGFVLMPGCDIPPTVPYENIRKFIEVAREGDFDSYSQERSFKG